MTKQQIAILEPANELVFHGPFTEVVTSVLKLTNPSQKNIAFKVKTTAPKQYCVRPNSGTIAPNEAVEVNVMLQPFKYDPNEKNRHKFMVQTMYAPDGADTEGESVWKSAGASEMVDAKLKCVFVMGGKDESSSNSPTSTLKTMMLPACGNEAREPISSEPEKRPAVQSEATSSPLSETTSRPEATAPPTTTSSPAPVKKTVTIAEPEQTPKVEREVKPAAPATESGVRQRNVPEPSLRSSSTPAPSTTQPVGAPTMATTTQQSGFPLQTVLAIIALAVVAWVLGQYVFR